MSNKKTYFNFGGIVIRLNKGKYYVYNLENVNGEIRERYLAPLEKVIETYEKMKSGVLGGTP